MARDPQREAPPHPLAPRRRGVRLTVVSDLDRRRVVEVLDARSRQRVERYRRSPPEHQSEAIEVVSIDVYEAN
jgi:transposase